ncbi:MAG: YceH family protein [Bryobacteraceae bacterium]
MNFDAQPLDPVETRVLACLIEKETTTPEYYPLTLNAAVNACNQKSNRDPVVSYDDEAVEAALDRLRARGLLYVTTGPGLRAPKYSHRLTEALHLGRREMALLCVLMLRGPQTAGELRDRAGRMHEFSDLEEVVSCLHRLTEHEPPLVALLERQAGRKERRYAHLLSGEVPLPAYEQGPAVERSAAGVAARVEALEGEVASLKEEIEALRRQFGDFRRQFE